MVFFELLKWPWGLSDDTQTMRDNSTEGKCLHKSLSFRHKPLNTSRRAKLTLSATNTIFCNHAEQNSSPLPALAEFALH